MGEYLTQGYTHRLRSTDIQQKIQNLLNNDYTIDDNGVNNCLNDLQTIIIDAGSKSLKIKKTKRRTKSITQPIKNGLTKNAESKDIHFEKQQIENIGTHQI
jgi:hypothetical protein